MQYDAKTPEDYLDQLDSDWRRSKLLELRDLIISVAPELKESIHYKMLGYGDGTTFAFHLNAQSGYVSLYVGNISRIDPAGELLSGLNLGKGCVRFTKTKQVDEGRVGEFIDRAYQLWKAGEKMGC
ncbi:iron chaperone [Roseibium sp. SCP14]|uniref:iron chaperone n=1 Tax=Roseibium sp. SCP14 TaxID=3141375 RepID=UPI003337AD52